MKSYRQGDVLLIPTDDRIEGEEIERKDGAFVLADGEVTGHAHVVRERAARMVRAAQAVYLLLQANAVLEHEEHGSIVLPMGAYRVMRQREYTPEEIRNVAD